jgi:hypothetical protein
MVKALYEVHRQSLRVLKISANTAPSEAFVEYLSAFLMGTLNIEALSLTWPDIETTFVDCIPNSAQRLELAVASRDKAQAILDHLLLQVYRLRYLRDIKFHIINPAHEVSSEHKESDSNPSAFSMPIQNPILTVSVSGASPRHSRSLGAFGSPPCQTRLPHYEHNC